MYKITTKKSEKEFNPQTYRSKEDMISSLLFYVCEQEGIDILDMILHLNKLTKCE